MELQKTQWIASGFLQSFLMTVDWSIEITVTNSSAFSDSNMWSSFGINVRSKKDTEDEIEIELAAQASWG